MTNNPRTRLAPRPAPGPGPAPRAPRRRPAAALWAALALLGAALVGCQPAAPGTSAPPGAGPVITATSAWPQEFVTRSGTQFEVAGRPFRFLGFNYFDAAATENYRCARWARPTDAELAANLRYLRQAAGATVLRFWAFPTYTRDGTDFSGIDRVLRIARENGMRVLPVLENGPGDCTADPKHTAKSAYQGGTWYQHGYQVPFGAATVSYRDYVRRIVTHYKDDPTILGWMMMNEAETRARDSAGRSVLVDFATDIGALIKSIDPRHLVTLGTQSNGAPGASGSDFAAVYGVASIDFAEVHDWANWGSDADPLPGSENGTTLPAVASPACARTDGAPLACSFAIAARSLHKPIIVGESGISAADGAGRARRAVLLEAKMRAAFQAGASGYLVWQFNRVVDTQKYDVLATDDDPLVPVMRRLAGDPPS